MSRISYRSPIATDGRHRYAAWVRALRGKSGVYVIRHKDGSVFYVGESHSGRLYKTLTRHFSTWQREKAWWQGAFTFAEDTDPGRTYDPDSTLVAVEITAPDKAYQRQIALVEQLRPRDNIIGQPAESGDDFDLFDFLD